MSPAEALARIQAALDAIKPIAWCTPTSVAAVTTAATAAAQSGADILPISPTYPELPVETVRSAVRTARSAARSLPDHPLRGVVVAKIDEADATVDAIGSRDDHKFSSWSRSHHGEPTPAAVKAAQDILAAPLPEETEPRSFTAADLQEAVSAALAHYSLDGWTAVTLERLATVSVDLATRQVRIRSDATFRRSDMARLLVHEVGGHVLRGENAVRQPDPVASFALGDATVSEEGLAAWLEIKFGVASPRTHRLYAARTVAAHLAADHGILSIIRCLHPAVGWDDATSISLRVKRGLSDLNSPGGFLKDQAYLSGLRAIADHMTSHPEDLRAIMATKWPLENLDTAVGMINSGTLQPADLLPEPECLGLAAFT
ncbi:tyrosine/phenylalanine carboxypeptidase domain-containing protein [Microlunatus sp. GCM10028923]|uniref:tyrosine/phenylalanine carboxypeptidase domain-containing protein n=1 Tax=Microlunatus sp. GCM10028923 TaxID=3273400 RepID=UPI0036085701